MVWWYEERSGNTGGRKDGGALAEAGMQPVEKRRTPGSGERRSGSHAKTTDSEADKESLAEKEEEDLVWESDVLGEARSPRDDEEEQKGSGEIEFL